MATASRAEVGLPGRHVSEPRRERLPIILQLTADDFAVAVWLRDEDGDLFCAFPLRGGRKADSRSIDG
jgi:hypothetical protein